ncbi:GDYXXLXY domain-containing protein [Leptospira yasudae]|uniref:GDYXXLXY protein n=1 Tax=Leptospira yasudae TaxID=2202201 RepID=A0A6N4QTD5_9LEPT|nr:GDYXXLXY domain-containing protein [Leptospira yasudae]TGL77451.1 GDYXXLXY protein [Leptospira yasudae]TGL81977.1 GDYXXLXY protein [Leptospira yasudae]TGL84766.1 GDYXXLXY protein [Leptospira yasudae]
MRTFKILLILALAAPVAFFASEIVYLEFVKKSGKELILPVSGYDPRDLLSGHYLRYNIEYQSYSLCQTAEGGEQLRPKAKSGKDDETHCVCYSHPGKIEEGDGTFVESCNPETLQDKKICKLYLRGECRYGRFTIGNERFYVNETKALDYEKRLRDENVHIRLKVDGDGKAITDSLIWADGSSL